VDIRPVAFSVDELWLLQSVIRHELAAAWAGSWPPANINLNDQIAEALVMCERFGVDSAILQLSRGDLYAIDYCVPAAAKDANGRPIGRIILLKSFEARQPEWGGEAYDEGEEAKLEKLEDWKHATADNETSDPAGDDTDS